MSRANQFLACMVVIVLFAGFLDIVGLPDHTRELNRDSARLIKAVVELLFVTFAVIMKIVERISNGNGVNITPANPLGQFEPEFESKPTVVQLPIPHPRKPHHCLCGYDLSANPDAWMQYEPEEIERCPECSRHIHRDDWRGLETKTSDAISVCSESQPG